GLSFGTPLDIGAVGVELPRLSVVGETGGEQRLEARMERRILDRNEGFHTTLEVPRHPVGRSDVVFRRAAVPEQEDAGVLKEAADDADDADAVAHAFDPRAQAADAADDEVDLHSRL